MTRERYDYIRELVHDEEGIAKDPRINATRFETVCDTAAWICFGVVAYVTYYSIPIPIPTPFLNIDGRLALGAAGYFLRRIGRNSINRRTEKMEDTNEFQMKVAKKYKERLAECQRKGLLPRDEPRNIKARKLTVNQKRVLKH